MDAHNVLMSEVLCRIQQERNEIRVAEAIRSMGARHVFHPSNRVKRLSPTAFMIQPHWPADDVVRRALVVKVGAEWRQNLIPALFKDHS